MHRAVGQCVFRDHRVFFFLSTAPNKAVNIFCKALILRDNILEVQVRISDWSGHFVYNFSKYSIRLLCIYHRIQSGI